MDVFDACKNIVTIVVPCFNEEAALPHFYTAVSEVVQDMPIQYEFHFVNDGSTDGTLEILHQLSNQDPHVYYDSFSRNFGKEAAMYAGLKASRGNYVVIMDADLQHPPKLLKTMYERLQESGADCAAAHRVDRTGEGSLRNFCSRKFYQLINAICCVKMDDGAGDYRMMSRQMVDSLLSFHEVNRYSKGLFSYIGFQTIWIDYENVNRQEGTSKWSMRSLFLYALEGITAFSNVPLLLAAVFGLIFCLVGFIILLYILFFRFDKVFLVICLLFFIGGMQMLFTGIFGEYLAKNVAEARHRPLYIIKETNRRQY